MDLLIYGSAIFAGIIGSRYLNRLANFCLMVAVFQLDLAILVSVMSGELRLRLLMPYTVVAIIPAMAGIIGGKYLGNVGKVCVVTGLCYVGTLLLALYDARCASLGLAVGLLFIQDVT